MAKKVSLPGGAGRSKGKGAGDKLPLLAVLCLEALLRLGKTAEAVAEQLQAAAPAAEDAEPVASDTGAHRLQYTTNSVLLQESSVVMP